MLRNPELSSVLVAVRLAGVAVAVGAVVELVVLAQAQPGGLGDLLGVSAGWAGLLRLAGGILVAVLLPRALRHLLQAEGGSGRRCGRRSRPALGAVASGRGWGTAPGW